MTQPLRYGIDVTLDGCVHSEAGLPPDAESMAFWTDDLRRSDSLLYGRVTYELMESAWRRPESDCTSSPGPRLMWPLAPSRAVGRTRREWPGHPALPGQPSRFADMASGR